MIYAASYRMLGSKAAAEDAVQETFMRLWRHAAKWKPQGAKFETWLYRVAMNICLDQLRKTKREAPEDAAPERSDSADRQDQKIFAAERRFAIDEALDKLPEGMAKIVKDSLNEQFWIRTSEYLYKERITLAKVMAEQDVQINTMPQDVQDKLAKTAQKMWDEEAKRSDKVAEVVEKLKGFLSDLGYL